MTVGRQRRLNKLLQQSTRTILLPIDHGFTSGPIAGIECIRNIGQWINSNKIHGVIAHKGMIERLHQFNILHAQKPTILHLNGAPIKSNNHRKKEPVTRVEIAHELGCDAVSIDLNFTPELTSWNCSLLGEVVDEAHQQHLPVLVMVSDHCSTSKDADFIQSMRCYMRSCLELGVDIIKANIPLDRPHDFYRQIFQGIEQDVPILMAGGGKVSPSTFCSQVNVILKNTQLKGLCIGRNVFQSSNPQAMLQSLISHEEEASCD